MLAKMVITCACPGCDNRYKTLRLRSESKFHPGKLTFHKFPTSDQERLKLWLLALGLDVNTPLSVLETRRLCSDHFSPFDFKDTKGSIAQLKSWAVPMNLSQQFVVSQIYSTTIYANNMFIIYVGFHLCI